MSHLQSLNIHKPDPLFLTHVMSYVFQMVSAERVVEYTELEKEAPWEYEYRPPLDWPHEGELAFENVNFRHTLDGPLVLKNLTAVFESRKKVCLTQLYL